MKLIKSNTVSNIKTGIIPSHRFLLKSIKMIATVLTVFALLNGCEDSSTDSDTAEPEKLKVKFENNASSDYTIISVLVQPMGKSNESTEPVGDWSSNVLPDGIKLAPGENTIFDLEIPNLHWSRYRLGVEDNEGNEIMLHEQNGYTESDLPITHWGSDERTVSVTVVYHESSGLIMVNGWSDFAGIDN